MFVLSEWRNSISSIWSGGDAEDIQRSLFKTYENNRFSGANESSGKVYLILRGVL